VQVGDRKIPIGFGRTPHLLILDNEQIFVSGSRSGVTRQSEDAAVLGMRFSKNTCFVDYDISRSRFIVMREREYEAIFSPPRNVEICDARIEGFFHHGGSSIYSCCDDTRRPVSSVPRCTLHFHTIRSRGMDGKEISRFFLRHVLPYRRVASLRYYRRGARGHRSTP
jgi:hypothetical protein